MGKNSSEKGSPLTKATKPTKANVCCTLLINVVMLVFFAIYSFKNPDDSDCYVVRDYEFREEFASPVEISGYDEKDMSLRFKIIFICGFLLCLINLCYAFVALIYFMYEAKSMLNIASCLVGLSGALTLAWMIYASIVIFGEDAQLCEDLMPKSTKFIYVWLILVYCFIGLLCCCSCMFICIVSSNKKKQKNKQKSQQ